MAEQNNKLLSCLLQLASIGFFIFALCFLCGVLWDISGITVSVGSSAKAVPTPAPTATLSPLFKVLAEQAKAQPRVTVVTTEADSGLGLGWYAIPVGMIVTGLGVGYVGVRYGKRGGNYG